MSLRLPPLLVASASLIVMASVGCVPSHPSESSPDAATPKPKKHPGSKAKSARTRRHDAKRSTQKAKRRSPRPGPMITKVFEDTFDRKTLGADWVRVGREWKIEDGKLCAQGARNKGIWLRRRLPINARIEFEATSDSSDGDIKAELWGDGMSGATSSSYTNATSYLTILGGWKNTFHVLARLDEHAKDRLELRVNPSSTHEREKPVVPGRVYAFRVERSDGKTVTWWVDGHIIHRLEDPNPLKGEGHDHFGFNDWDVPVCFDNVRITPL